MRVRVLFFGMLKDVAGAAEQDADVPEGATLADLLDRYAGELPRLGAMRASIVLARNREFAPPATPLADGDEIAFLPPVSGGASEARPKGAARVAGRAGS